MIESLKTAQEAWSKDYQADAIPEVWATYKEYRAEFPDRYPYNSDIESYMAKKFSIPAELLDFLGTQVYLAQRQNDRERTKELDAKMALEGFLPINSTVTYRGQVEVHAKKNIDWMSVKVAETGKFIDSERYGGFFIPTGKRTRGYTLLDLEGYYKPVTE